MEIIKLGLRENSAQFTLLVIINAFVGGMIGMERSVLPQLAESLFGISSKTAMLSFIVAFGITKAICNYFTGKMANKLGRKNLLIIGWLFGLPIPFVLIYAPDWNWVVLANVLLGINQGLSWSAAVMMKIDLVGEKNRGLAVGINEFAGYLSVGLVAFFTGWIAAEYGVRPYPFYLGIAFSILGLLLTVFLLKDTRQHVSIEQETNQRALLQSVFWDTTFRHPSLGAVSQAGLVNNLNDGMIWGLWPLILLSKGFDLAEVGLLSAIYPVTWGLSQLLTGRLSDLYPKKQLLFWGMLLQGLAILVLVWANGFYAFMAIGLLLGIGTALVYPTFLNAISTLTNPAQRAESLGIFRFWRDSGYAVGALLTGFLADLWNTESAVLAIGLVTVLSAIVIWFRYKDE